MLMMITYGLGFIVIPIDASFVFGKKRAENLVIWEIASVIDVICLIDIAINFLSCYQDQQTKRIVLDGRKIARHYIRNYFWIDVLSSIPDRLILIWFFGSDDLIYGNDINECLNTSRNSLGSCFWDIASILSLLKIIQLPLFFKYLTNYLEDQHKRSEFTIKIIKNIFTIIICYHFTVCLHFLILRIFASSPDYVGIITGSSGKSSLIEKSFWTDTNDVEKYIICFFYTTYTLTLFASTIEEKSQVDMTVGIIFTLIGFSLHIWLVSEAYMYLTTSYGPCLGFQEIRYQLGAYIAFKHIPKSIQLRILSYYDFSFKDKFYSKEQISTLLGGELRQSIAIEICQEHLWNSYIFKTLPENLLKPIASCMVEETYLQNDIISRNDFNHGQKLYFIVHGTVAVYTKDGNEMAHLYDRNMFGAMEFLQYRESITCMYYVAAEECLILILQKTDFMRIMAENTELINQMRKFLNEESVEKTVYDNENGTSSSNTRKKVII
ncbi:hypothetical protein ACKWTF_005035 [Chironomus riparius]